MSRFTALKLTTFQMTDGHLVQERQRKLNEERKEVHLSE